MIDLVVLLEKKIKVSGVDYVSANLTRSYAGSYIEEVSTLGELRTFLGRVTGVKEITKDDYPDGAFSRKCRYYTALVPEGYTGNLFVQTFGEIDDKGMADKVRPALKGPESDSGTFVADASVVDRTTTNIITIIIDKNGLRTWYPGPLPKTSKGGKFGRNTLVKGLRATI